MINEKILVESNSSGKNISNAIDYNLMPRFRWYGYKEGFSPSLVEEAISKVGIDKDDYILDPFNGNGTVTLTASMNSIRSIGIEVNPFVAFMSQAKLENFNSAKFSKGIDRILTLANEGKRSPISRYSTFSEKTGKDKWLFNSNILNSFEGGWQALAGLPRAQKKILQLSLIGAAMDNCNAVKDGKCLKYRKNWREREFGSDSFLKSLEDRLRRNKEDLNELIIPTKAFIINNDSRKAIKSISDKYKLCVTSPPYLNSFDYTDIYRPELFLGKFIKTSQELKNLRYQTIRSHVEIILPKPTINTFGEIYHSVHKRISNSDCIWSKQIPTMIQSYFEDMQNVLIDLLSKAKENAQLWLVVANSVYVGIEIPVDLILAEIGTRNGWKLNRIEVLRYINRRKTKYSGNIDKIRESLIVFENK
ncbi:DNA methyltransferase [Dysgonomonas capnocytophagoides]|uniref:DNA methyltransferase n=1 Tax=Dysgonomonas capnocytophagoides TaxID=45254 RepID=UPI00291FC3D5|nr:hypothetical protein DCPSUM001_00780 [Dysgonomonas capnocytophagoides]